MFTLGNDIVDLEDPETLDTARRERFIARVFSPEEQSLLRLAPENERHALLWSLWAAKEAAYKAVCRLRGATVFAHRRFVVQPDLNLVHHEQVALHLNLQRTTNWVHAIVWRDGPPPHTGVARARTSPGTEVRDRLLEHATQVHLRSRERHVAPLHVERRPAPNAWTGRGPPHIVQPGAPLTLRCSISHHGRYLAWAFEP